MHRVHGNAHTHFRKRQRQQQPVQLLHKCLMCWWHKTTPHLMVRTTQQLLLELHRCMSQGSKAEAQTFEFQASSSARLPTSTAACNQGKFPSVSKHVTNVSQSKKRQRCAKLHCADVNGVVPQPIPTLHYAATPHC